MSREGRENILWFWPLLAVAVFFSIPLINGESLFLRFAWDANNILAFFPWDVFSSNVFHAGFFPLWNPHNACGAPHLANLQSAPLFPLHLLLFISPTVAAFDALYVSRFAILFAGAFLAAREFGCEKPGAICAAVAATFSGYFVAYGSMVHINAEMLLPYAIWLALRMKRSIKFADWTGLALVYLFALIGGNIESAFFVLAVGTGFALLSGWKTFAGSLLAAGVAIVAASPQLLPFFEYLPHAWHIHPSGAANQFLDATGIYSIAFVNPLEIDGRFVPYSGAAVLLLASIGARKNARSLFAIALCAIILGLTYGAPIIKWLAYLPVLSRVASYKYALAPLAVLISLAAGVGVDAILKNEIKPAAVARAALCVGFFAAMFPLGAWVEHKSFPLEYFAVSIASIAAVAVLSLNRKTALYLIPGVVALELVAQSQGLGLKKLLDPLEYAKRPEIQFAVAHKDAGRVVALQTDFPSNLNLLFGIDDANSLDALYPKQFVRKMSGALGFAEADATEYFKSHGYSFPIEADRAESYIWQDIGVRYYIGGALKKRWMLDVGDSIFEDPLAPAILQIDGSDAVWTSTSGGQKFGLESPTPIASIKFRQNYMPGWRAFADGREIKIESADDGFMNFSIEGAEEFQLEYRPAGFRIGLWAAIAFTANLFCVILLRVVKRKSSEALT